MGGSGRNVVRAQSPAQQRPIETGAPHRRPARAAVVAGAPPGFTLAQPRGCPTVPTFSRTRARSTIARSQILCFLPYSSSARFAMRASTSVSFSAFRPLIIFYVRIGSNERNTNGTASSVIRGQHKSPSFMASAFQSVMHLKSNRQYNGSQTEDASADGRGAQTLYNSHHTNCT